MLILSLIAEHPLEIQARLFKWEISPGGRFRVKRGNFSRTGTLELDYRGFEPILMIKYDNESKGKRLGEGHPIFEKAMKWLLGLESK